MPSLVSDTIGTDTISTRICATVLGVAELCLAIASYVFNPDDPLSARDIYALRLTSHRFSRGLIDVIVLRSISVRWNPPFPPRVRLGSTLPKDSRPPFDGKLFAAGSLLPDMTERCLVKEVLVSTAESYDHDGKYPFGGNRHFLAEVVARLRYGFVHPENHPLRVVLCGNSFWDWAMLSGLTQALDGIPAIHVVLRAPYYFPVLDNLEGIREPSFHFLPILNDTNPHRVASPLDALPQYLCDTLVVNQPKHDVDLQMLLHSTPERLRNVVVKMVVGANMVVNPAYSMPLPVVFTSMAAISTFTWVVDVDGSRTDEHGSKRLHKVLRMLTGRITLLIDIISRLPPDNGLCFLDLELLIEAPYDDHSACLQLRLTVAAALRSLAERLATDSLEKVLLSVHIALRPSSKLEREDRSTDFTFDGLRLPSYQFRPEKERVTAEFDGLKAFLTGVMQPVGRAFIWSVVSSEKSDTCTAKRERYWESKEDLLPWNLDALFPSPALRIARQPLAPPPRYVVIRAFTGRHLPVRVD
jgi:hypothetical protein